MKSAFAGTMPLVRHILRRDRIRLTAWIVGCILFMVAFVPVLAEMFSTEAEMLSMLAMMENPAMIAMVGPMHGLTFGSMYAAMMLVMTGILVAVMNILLVTRHTRKDEEQGRLEVIRSLPIGRLANLNATLVVAVIVNVIIALGIGFGMPLFDVDSVTLSGAMLSGFAIGACGLSFAAITAIFCQLSSNTRTASSFAFLAVSAAYMLRAVGDVSAEILSLITPVGLLSFTQAFYQDYWWPVFVILAMTVIATVIAFGLAKRRDLGQGIFAAKPGRAVAKKSLSTPFGLALRLTKTSIWVWAAVLFVLGAMYGAVMEEVELFIGGSEMMQELVAAMGTGTLTENFISMISFVMALAATVPVLMLMMRVRAEEKGGYTEQVLARSVSRNSLFGAYFSLAFVGSIVFPIVSSMGMWVAMVGTMIYPPELGTHLSMTLNYLPAIWVMLGLAALLVGYLPRKAGLTYAYLFFSFFVIYIGGMVGFPDEVMMISPFGALPSVPMEEFSLPIFLVLSVLGFALMIFGFVGHRKRDVLTG